jgi:uncharacterized membrane protein YagU involved in acid resistance
MNRMKAGVVAGLVATVPMTAVMLALHRRLPLGEQYPLPPQEITAEMAEKAGLDEHVGEPEHGVATTLTHFGYGAATGGIYGALIDGVDAPPAALGAAYGVAVWVASYLGLLPALRILRPAMEHPARRNALMIAAHLVWGVTLGILADRWREER